MNLCFFDVCRKELLLKWVSKNIIGDEILFWWVYINWDNNLRILFLNWVIGTIGDCIYFVFF